MQTILPALIDYVSETRRLDSLPSSTEPTFYPAINNLIAAVQQERLLPFEVRVNTSEANGKARHAKDQLTEDSKAVKPLLDDYRQALGLSWPYQTRNGDSCRPLTCPIVKPNIDADA
ncbi:hypothetical protein [Methylocystis parvus]|uniref:Uncharacterized protein n=1 Tax=Methylocystis parvus TaxID=134 RepID=A0A6B8M7H1_9HYPH|nr:hypothetical protein [Methylocystis parvus]QGM98436.1 hypothetical protein F7D14_13760 [Methylocystis parvus]WBK01227.1 hypothetical protein MMG94_05810 [Methylocystis parvus OBBP]